MDKKVAEQASSCTVVGECRLLAKPVRGNHKQVAACIEGPRTEVAEGEAMTKVHIKEDFGLEEASLLGCTGVFRQGLAEGPMDS